jgi:hypothetical protein
MYSPTHKQTFHTLSSFFPLLPPHRPHPTDLSMHLISLLPLTTLLISTTSAAPLRPRQLTSATLSLSWSEPNHDSVFISNKNYNCGPYTLIAYGAFDPFTIDVVAGQTVLSTLGNGFGAGNISWQPDVPLGTTFALRLTDSRNSTALSTPVTLREIKGKDKWGCECVLPSLSLLFPLSPLPVAEPTALTSSSPCLQDDGRVRSQRSAQALHSSGVGGYRQPHGSRRPLPHLGSLRLLREDEEEARRSSSGRSTPTPPTSRPRPTPSSPQSSSLATLSTPS